MNINNKQGYSRTKVINRKRTARVEQHYSVSCLIDNVPQLFLNLVNFMFNVFLTGMNKAYNLVSLLLFYVSRAFFHFFLFHVYNKSLVLLQHEESICLNLILGRENENYPKIFS